MHAAREHDGVAGRGGREGVRGPAGRHEGLARSGRGCRREQEKRRQPSGAQGHCRLLERPAERAARRSNQTVSGPSSQAIPSSTVPGPGMLRTLKFAIRL